MTASHFKATGLCVAGCVLAALAILAPARAQPQEPVDAATVQGHVRDSSGRPVPNATVSLEPTTGSEAFASHAQIARTDPVGVYRFETVPEGIYALRAEMNGYAATIVGTVSVARKETKRIDLVLVSAKASEAQSALSGKPETGKPGAPAPEFFDEPQFTVAGVTQATNSGGHGSDTVLRTTEALAKATVALSKESAFNSTGTASAPTVDEESMRTAATREPESIEANRRLGEFLIYGGKAAEALPYLDRASRLNPADAELHHLLGSADEMLGNPLDAVRQYHRAAELDPSEPNLFDWGTELLTHRALIPAAEVFEKGNRLFPKSVRMLVGLGVAWYARGSYEQATQCLAKASDLDPGNPTPYLFLGRLQSAEAIPSSSSLEKLKRFAQLQPDDALANYYYAVGLWKQSLGSTDSNAGSNDERSAQVEALLQKAVHLDPNLGAAYVQLGILYSDRADFSRAISAYQTAIEVSPELDEPREVAHYRLAQAYIRMGDKAKAKQELQLHSQLSKKTKEDSDRKRRDILQFVVSLQNKNSVSPPQP